MPNQAGSFSFSSLGTSNRTVGAALVGAGGSRPGAGGLARVYNWCGRNQPDNIVACVFGGAPETPSLWVLGAQIQAPPVFGSNPIPELWTSPDGVTWTPVVNQPFTVGNLSGIYYENGLWFATCMKLNYFMPPTFKSIAVSKDGFTWTTLDNDPFTSGGALFVTYAQGQWVACGLNLYNIGLDVGSTLATSKDGTIWTLLPNSQKFVFTEIVYGKGWWVGVGTFGVAYSQNLQTDNWSIFPPPPPSPSPSPEPIDKAIAENVIFNGTNWVACSLGNLYFTSSPGAGWYIVDNLTNQGKTIIWEGVQYFQGTWFAYGPSGLYTSSDKNLAVWTNTFPVKTNGVSYAKGIYVAYGMGALSLSYSTNGQSWTQVPLLSGIDSQIVNVGFQGGTWVAVGIEIINKISSPKFATSPDGRTWTLQPFPKQTLQLLGVQNSAVDAVTYGRIINRGGSGGGFGDLKFRSVAFEIPGNPEELQIYKNTNIPLTATIAFTTLPIEVEPTYQDENINLSLHFYMSKNTNYNPNYYTLIVNVNNSNPFIGVINIWYIE